MMTLSFLTNFADSHCNTESSFFNIFSWHKYLQKTDVELAGSPGVWVCDVNFNIDEGHLWLVVIAIVEMIIFIAAVVALGVFLYSAVRLSMSQGAPEQVANARKGMFNAIIGMVIAMTAVSVTSFIAGSFSETGSGGNFFIPRVDASGNVIGNIVLPTFLQIAIGISLVYLVWAGFKYVTSQGNPDQTSSALKTIIYSIIGLVLALSARVIVGLVAGSI